LLSESSKSNVKNDTLSKTDVDLNINLDYGEVEVRISQFMVLMSDPLQMRSLYHEDVLKVNEGNDLLLSCRVRGRPTPLISWYVNQTEIKYPWRLETGRGIIQKSRYLSKLQLSNVHPTDNANYTCLAENVNGHIRKSVKVIVKATTTLPPPTTTTLATTELTTASVHPCHNYCHRGHCYIIDGNPYCRCDPQYLGEHCE
ncbi:Schwann cell myelin protein, partial [Schistosoma japonicum]